MAVGDTLAGDSFNSCIDLKSSDPVLESQQMAADSLEVKHTAVSNKMGLDSALPAALLTDMCIFIAKSFFVTISSTIGSDKMKVVFAGSSATTPGKDHARNGCCGCRGNFISSSCSTSAFLDGWRRWKPSLAVSYGDLKLNAINRPKLTFSSTNSRRSSSSGCSSSGCSRNCCSIGSSKGACGSFSIRQSSGESRMISSNRRSSRSGSLGIWCSLEVVLCAVVVCLMLEVCSAACLDKANCSSTQFNPRSQTHIDYNTTSSDSHLSVHNRTGTGSFRKNHSHGVLFSTQDFVLENTVLTSQELLNADASQHLAKDVAETAFLSATRPAATAQEGDEDLSKIIGVVIPFCCVIFIAIILCVMWKLCRKYRCCNNEACLQKCAALCDSCMSAPYAFQVPAHVKVQSQMSRDSTGLTLISQNRPGSVSQTHRSAGNIVRPPYNKLNMPSHGMSSASVSRHGSSRSGRQVATNAHGARQTTQSPRHVSGQSLGAQQKLAYASVHRNET